MHQSRNENVVSLVKGMNDVSIAGKVTFFSIEREEKRKKMMSASQ